MKLKNKLELGSTLKVGALPTASTSNYSVLFENGGLVSKRTVGNIINYNSSDFISGISNSFPSIFNYNTSTTATDPSLVVSFKNQLAGTVLAAPATLNGTPSFRKLIDSDLSETSLGSKANASGNNLTNIQTWRDNLGIGTLNNLTTTDKSNLVNAINEVNGNIPNVTGFVPYMNNSGGSLFATSIYNKSFGVVVYGAGSSVVLDTNSTQLVNAHFEFTFVFYGNRKNRILIGFDNNNTTSTSNLKAWCSNPDEVLSVSVGRRIADNNQLSIIVTFKNSLSRPHFSVNSFNSPHLHTAGLIWSSRIISDLSEFSLVTSHNSDFLRDSYYLDYGNLTNKPTIPTTSDYITTNTNQTGLSGNKTTSGVWTFGEVRKSGQNDTQILLAGGGHRPVSDFALASEIITPNNGLLTISTSSDLTGGGTFSADQATASDVEIGLSSGTLSNIQLGVTAHGWGDFRQFGLGTIGMPEVAILSKVTNTGFYRINNTNTSASGAPAHYGSLIHLSRAGTEKNEIFLDVVSDNMYFRRIVGSTVGEWRRLYHTGNFNPAQYVLQSALNTQLANYVPINGVITINNTKTFTSSPIVPNATLNGHAVNLGQVNSIIDNFNFVTDEALNSYIKKGVHNVNPAGQPFSIHANYGTLDWNGNGFSFVTDSEQEFEYIEDEQAIGVNPFKNYGFYLNNQRLRFTIAGNSSELLPSSGVSKSKLPTTGSTQRTLAVGATMGGNTYYANDNGLIDLPSSDGILSYSSANGIIVTDWNSFALSEYAMSLGYGSVTSGNYATSVGGLLSTTGFGSTNQGYSNSITKPLGYSLGAYNSVRATLSGAFGIGLINRNDGAFVVGRYNSELPIEPYDTTSPHKQAVFAIGAGRDETDRFTALTVYGDGRADYTEGYDDSNWTNNTLVTKKWVLDNVSGGGSGGGGGVGYRNVDSSATFNLSSEYSGAVAENVYHIMTTSTVTFIGGNAVYNEGYKITIMTYGTGANVVLDNGQGVKFIGSSGSQISYLDKPNRSVTFIYDKDYESFRVYHVSGISL